MKPVEAAGKVNYFLDAAIPVLTPFGVILGVIFPGVLINIRPFIPWLFGTITLAGALRLRAREMRKAASSPLPLLYFFISAHVLMPLVVFFITRLIFSHDHDTVAGYVLLYSIPTAVTAFIWITIYHGDRALSLTIILLDTILAPLVVPGTVKLLLRTSVSLDMTGMALSLVFMILLPTILGIALNELSQGKIPSLVSPYLNPLSKVSMVLVIAANTAAVAPQINLDNPRLLPVSAVCIGLSTLGFLCGKLTGLITKNQPKKEITLLFACGLRNTSAAMTLGIEFFPPAAALPSVLGIIFQQTIAAIMSRIFYGKINKK